MSFDIDLTFELWILNFLSNLQKQPEHIRKIILWAIVIIIGLILVFFWFRGIAQKIEKLESEKFIEQVNLSDFKKELENVPQIEMPELSEEELRQLEEELEKSQTPNGQ